MCCHLYNVLWWWWWWWWWWWCKSFSITHVVGRWKAVEFLHRNRRKLTTINLRSSLSFDVTQLPTFRSDPRSHIQGAISPRINWYLKIGLICCPETSVTPYLCWVTSQAVPEIIHQTCTHVQYSPLGKLVFPYVVSFSPIWNSDIQGVQLKSGPQYTFFHC